MQDAANVVGVVMAGDRDGTGVRAETAGAGVGGDRADNTAGVGAAAAGAGVVVRPHHSSHQHVHGWVC